MNLTKFFMALPLCVLFVMPTHADNSEEKQMTLGDINLKVHQNRSVIIEQQNLEIAKEQLTQASQSRLPELMMNADGYLSQKLPLMHDSKSSHLWRYHTNLYTEFEIYSGGLHRQTLKRAKTEQQMSEEQLRNLEQETNLKAYIMLYDIYRNTKYLDFIRSSILLRTKEYERINQFYLNGLVLKSDLLRSKLYITDLEKDEIEIQNSISILSDQLCALLGEEEYSPIKPMLEGDLKYQITDSFDTLFEYALEHSPRLKVHRLELNREEHLIREMKSFQRPQLKLYAQYGVGSPLPYYSYDHQLGGEIGFKLSFKISAFYKNHHKIQAQRLRLKQAEVQLTDEETKLKNTLYELYTRYHESLLNINRALEKIDMSKESMRILRNSYFNQQALLIDVLESETQSMQASFEWVEAVVDSQKYYWALKQICGYL